MKDQSDFKLAISATTHCLLGCGLGEVSGFVVGTIFGLTYLTNIFLGIAAGLFFGFLFGMMPLLKAGMHLSHVFKIVLTTEFLSIIAMEIGEAGIELTFPGMKKVGILHLTYWLGLLVSLGVGFLASFPVNLFLVRRGVRHQH
ncbi:MAG TPA: DUF4396 domain-containing protein [Patescibacteria group bacterium]|nr:DUF4396 domain-containing protein [Patescibacteria group bacterium]